MSQPWSPITTSAEDECEMPGCRRPQRWIAEWIRPGGEPMPLMPAGEGLRASKRVCAWHARFDSPDPPPPRRGVAGDADRGAPPYSRRAQGGEGRVRGSRAATRFREGGPR